MTGEPASDRARRAASFAAVADAYERARPSYPREAIDWLLGPRALRVADLGAGTGKLTGALTDAGHDVIAIEPLAEMRAILRRQVPQAAVIEGRAEQIPLDEGSVDAVVAGAAFHWFDREPALREITRILTAPGVLGVLGNGFDPAAAWVARLREALGGSRLGRRGHWPEPDELGSWFAEVERRDFQHSQRVTLDVLFDLARSRSGIAVRSEVERQEVFAAIASMWREEVDADEAVLGYRTRVLRCCDARGAR